MISTILSDRNAGLKTIRPLDGMGYDAGCVLTRWTFRGAESVALDHNELRALIAVLPTPLLLEALGARGLIPDDPPLPRQGAAALDQAFFWQEE